MEFVRVVFCLVKRWLQHNSTSLQFAQIMLSEERMMQKSKQTRRRCDANEKTRISVPGITPTIVETVINSPIEPG